MSENQVEAGEVEAALTRMKSDVACTELPRTVIEVAGDDRARFLHNYCTNDINRMTLGTGCEVFITSVQGKTLLYALVFCHEDRFVIDAPANQASTVLPHLQKYAMLDDVKLTDRSNELRNWLLLGPKSSQVLSQLELPCPEEMLSHQSVDGVSVLRVPFATVPSFMVQATVESSFSQRLEQNGLEFVAPEVVEAARIEARFPKSGQDVTEDNLPQEVNRDASAISFTKGCYLGQETVARIDALGHVNKYLVAFESSEPLTVGDEIFAENNREKAVGLLTSVAQLNERSLALGFLRREVLEAKNSLATAKASLRLAD